MCFTLQGYFRRGVFLIPSILLVAYTSPSYAETKLPSDIVSETVEEGETTRSCSLALSILSESPIRRPVDPACVTQGTTKPKLLQLQNSPKPSTPVTQSQDFSKPSTPVTPAQDSPKPSTPVTQSQDFSKPSTPVTPAQDFSKPSTPVTAAQDSPKPSTPVTAAQDSPKPSTSVTAAQDSPKPSTSVTAAQDSPKPSTPVTPVQDSSLILVKKIELINSSVPNSRELDPIIKRVEGSTVSLAELRKVADQITGWYFQKGYITSIAIVDESAIKDGIVPIKVIEGSVEEIKIDPPTRGVRSEYVRSRIALGIGQPFSQTKLEEQLRLLQSDPLFTKIEASIRPGSIQGKSIVVVRVTEADPLDIRLSIDNYSPPSVGSERLGINVINRNLTGLGDQLAASYYFSTKDGGSKVYDLSYQVPLNPMNGTVQFRGALSQTKVIQPPFDILDIAGESLLYEITYRQPLVRTLKEEFALSLGFTVQDGQTFTFAGPTPFGIGPDLDGNSRTRTFKFAQDYVRRDAQGVWGLRSQFNLGVGWFDATFNPEPKPDGRFFSWFLQAQRQQRLGQDNILIVQADLQFAPTGLLPSQQFVTGGGQSVRGYRQNIRAGDNGLRFSLEDRIVVQRDSNGKDVMQIAPFFDMGYIWNAESNPNILQEQQFIAGLGLGFLWKPIPELNLRLDYALPLIELKDRGQNAQDSGFYFNASYGL
ncbi:hemolysin activation/secretion protein [Cylindrospermum stagnale PCC 7417]|uniref:Hemolysin activation/secretion protein n=1 Tax=Cylindrospermum stagnale PCC 7417 TaxID=56107 RepID=K9X305_9NOST|nr:ShlB/FhaC/HecB family hemolysin secretion/activation protein [Cylindrospermum stagnale]AFZ27025.1 hemolysin activation/secretion protein [Cylindrospermum stagnale PCC 7417]